MTNLPIEPLDLLDTDYADILAHGSDPLFELQLARLGIDPASARTTTNFLTSRATKIRYSSILGSFSRGVGSRLRVRAKPRTSSTNSKIAVESPSKKS